MRQNMWAVKCKHGFLTADTFKENVEQTSCIRCDEKFHSVVKVVVIEKEWKKKRV